MGRSCIKDWYLSIQQLSLLLIRGDSGLHSIHVRSDRVGLSISPWLRLKSILGHDWSTVRPHVVPFLNRFIILCNESRIQALYREECGHVIARTSFEVILCRHETNVTPHPKRRKQVPSRSAGERRNRRPPKDIHQTNHSRVTDDKKQMLWLYILVKIQLERIPGL